MMPAIFQQGHPEKGVVESTNDSGADYEGFGETVHMHKDLKSLDADYMHLLINHLIRGAIGLITELFPTDV